MNPVRFLLGANVGDDFESALTRGATSQAWAPFDPRATAFVGRLSQRLLMHPEIRSFPELAALAHWFRGARLREMAAAHTSPLDDAVVLGRGLAFHVAPANVDSVFMYSWLISLLAGNGNWVRVSQKPSPQLDFLIEILRETLAEDVGQPVAGRIVLLTYEHDAAVTTAISRKCMLRVVWGGDETVATLRAIPLRPTAMEICFPDRFSAAALHAQAVLQCHTQALKQLVSAFHNDAFWFAQQACSSPRLVNWVGSAEDCAAAQARFWSAVEQELARRHTENTPAMGMARLTTAFELAAAELGHPVDVDAHGPFPARVELESPLTATMKALHCGNGLFLEQRTDSLAELADVLTDKEQTLSVFGFSRQELVEFVHALPPRAVDRIAPIGDALTFAPVWDGVDLFSIFTRRISLPPALVSQPAT